ncbi:MAG: hypothetical protein H6605_03105 [Flavobacteriales bacterium]|nr:hypothetical protein [Flavobacteriales bacterium]
MEKSIKIYLLLSAVLCMNFLLKAQEWQEFRMKGNECRTFITNGNSRIIVQAGTFIEDQNKYTGPITILFKEYKDQVDFILAGLDLKYEINGNKGYLQSGGMFEIKFEVKDKPSGRISIDKSKPVTVKLAIDKRFDAAGLEPFQFDANKKKWIKNTRFGQSGNSNRSLPDDEQKLWQDDPITQEFQNGDLDGYDDECYTIQIPVGKDDPVSFKDTLICPGQRNNLDDRYTDFLSDQVFKTMQISEMGLYNFDKIFKEDNAVPMFVDLKNEKGDPIELTDKLYVVYKSSNTVIYYTSADLKDNFKLIPRDDVKIFIVQEDGSLYKFPENKLKRTDILKNRDKILELKLDKVKMTTLTKEAFAMATGLTP